MPGLKRRQLIAGCAIGLGSAAVGLLIGRPHGLGSVEVAPAELWQLRFERPHGGEVRLAEWRGSPLVLNFWATWCAPCVRELPEIDRFARDFENRGWKALALAIDRVELVREFLVRVPLRLPVAMAGSQGFELLRLLGNSQGGLPFSVVVSSNGSVLQRRVGETSYSELAALAGGV